MAGGIFISWRRNDNRHAAWRIYEALKERFPKSQVFFDLDGIEPGLDFEQVLNERIAGCDAVVAMIGPGWHQDRERLAREDDFVRIELEAALTRGVRVVPVLVDGAEMPTGDLPGELPKLLKRQSLRLSHQTFKTDIERLLQVLEKDVKTASPSKPAFFKATSQPSTGGGTASQPTDAAQGEWWVTLLAALPLIANLWALPTFFGVDTQDWWNFKRWHWLSAFYVSLSTLALVLLSLLLLRRRLAGRDIGLLWLAATVSCIQLLIWLQNDIILNDIGRVNMLGVWFVGVVILCAATIVLYRRRRPNVGAIEIALYVLSFVAMIFFGANAMLRLA